VQQELTQGGSGRPCAEVPITRAQPTAAGVWLGFTGSDDLWNLGERYLELFMPWAELRG
jgi:hypothetical protein